MMENEELFEKNRARFAFFSEKDADLLSFPEKKGRVSFSPNDNGELNLKIEKDGQAEYVYSRESVKEEALKWFSSLRLENIKILYIFGVGLGSYYEVCKEWLLQDASRFLIFLEDDKEIISHFFQTELCTTILHDKQVRLQYVDEKENADITGLDGLITAFLFDAYQFSNLKFYRETRTKFSESLSQYLSHTIYSKQSRIGEFLTGSLAFYTNFYNNLKFLPDGYSANELEGKFKNVPAIICGAGPSLEKNIQLLKTLADKALIIAGGSAINALNSYDLFPHFTAGIDPNPSQLIRILANNSYETPFFYRNRILTEALNVNLGPKLYVTGAGGYEFPKWVEKKLHIKESEVIDEGYNVINFSVSIAKKLGCNPIILCGVDLAYTNNQSYLAGIKFHALHNFKQSFITKTARDELIGFRDINGETTSTLWKWVNESTWYSYFVEHNPEIILVNATEGGIGFSGVKNMTLSAVSDLCLKQTYDFENMIHGEIQNSRFPKELDATAVLKMMKVLRKSLGECEEILGELIDECRLIASNRVSLKKTPVEPIVKKIEKLQEELHKKDYYTYVLKRFSENYLYVVEKRAAYFLYDLEKDNEESKMLSKVELELDCYKFIQSVMKLNKEILESAIKNYPERATLKKTKKQKNVELTRKKIDVSSEEKKVTYYPNHSIKEEQSLKNGLLEGPSIYYSQSGHVLAKSYYDKGLRDGKSQFYYSSGTLFAVKDFKNGLPDGLHEFYYENGSLKSQIHYKNGKLDGDVWMYYPDKKLKRELHFKDGKREGVEKMWNASSFLILEANYLDDKAVGVANWWYDNGNLQQKVTHHENTEDYEIQCFTSDGKEIPKQVVESEDYFDKLIKVTNTIMASIEDIFQKTDVILPLLEGGDKEEIQNRKKQLESLRIEVEKLTEMNEYIRKNFSGNAHNFQEPIWKSSALEAQIEGQLNGLVEVMKKEIESMQGLIQKVIDKRK